MSDDLKQNLRGSCYLAFEDGTNDYETAPEAADRIEELEAELKALNHAYDSIVTALSFEGLRTDEAEAKLAVAMVGLVQSRDELDQYSQEEYPSDHPVHERYRKRDYDANPARIAIAKIKGEQP
jgi:hypothetical protein